MATITSASAAPVRAPIRARRLRFGDLDGNGLTDLWLYAPLRPDSPIRIGANRGNLPGTPPGVGPRSGGSGS